MKTLRVILFLPALLLLGVVAYAQTYTFLKTSVTSSSTPVQIMPAATRNTYGCKTLSSAAGPVDVWSYSPPTLPVSKPTNYTVINAGDHIGDGVITPAWNSPMMSNAAVGLPWAAVLDSGSSAVTVFCWWR